VSGTLTLTLAWHADRLWVLAQRRLRLRHGARVFGAGSKFATLTIKSREA
jgi:hypothetical protein